MVLGSEAERPVTRVEHHSDSERVVNELPFWQAMPSLLELPGGAGAVEGNDEDT